MGEQRGRGGLRVMFVEQQLTLQIAEFYVVAVDHADEAGARPRQRFGLYAAQSAASHHGDTALQNAILALLADFAVTYLAGVALFVRGSHSLSSRIFPKLRCRSSLK